MRIFRICISVLFILSLSACGWHLRGSAGAGALPFSAIALEDNGADAGVYQALERQLAGSGVRLSPSARLRLVLGQSRWRISRTGLTLTGDTAAELLSLKQPFELWRDGQRLLSDTAEVYRDHQIDTSALAAAEAERRQLQQQMREAAARQILRQLRHVK